MVRSHVDAIAMAFLSNPSASSQIQPSSTYNHRLVNHSHRGAKADSQAWPSTPSTSCGVHLDVSHSYLAYLWWLLLVMSSTNLQHSADSSFSLFLSLRLLFTTRVKMRRTSKLFIFLLSGKSDVDLEA